MRWTVNGCKGCVLDENSIFWYRENKKKHPFEIRYPRKLGQYRFPVDTCRRKGKKRSRKKNLAVKLHIWALVPPEYDIKSKFSVGNSASNTPETTWLFVFWPNGSDGTKFGRCFYIGLDLRDRFARSLLGENGYFFVFWHFRPSFKLILHTSKWMLCKQKF